jgi:peptidoglycan hydrolase CwlO-like protein
MNRSTATSCLSLWMMMDGAIGTHTKKKRETDEMTDEMIERDNLVMNQAQEIDNLRHELERIKGIASRRLDRIAQLQHDVAVLEDKLEDTRSELKSTFGGAPSRAIEELEIERNLAMIYEHDELGREPRSHIDYE